MAAISARLLAISQRPWTRDKTASEYGVYCDDPLGSRVADCFAPYAINLGHDAFDANADFIANAPDDIAWLLDQLSTDATEREARPSTSSNANHHPAAARPTETE